VQCNASRAVAGKRFVPESGITVVLDPRAQNRHLGGTDVPYTTGIDWSQKTIPVPMASAPHTNSSVERLKRGARTLRDFFPFDSSAEKATVVWAGLPQLFAGRRPFARHR